MIQRIQTVYLFLAALAAIAFLFIPFGSVLDQNTIVLLKGNMHPILQGLVGAIAGIALIAIFLFKNRKNQALLVLLDIIISLGFFAFVCFGAYMHHQKDTFHFGVGFILPIFTLVFNFLAYKSIKADDALVKSMDRLR